MHQTQQNNTKPSAITADEQTRLLDNNQFPSPSTISTTEGYRSRQSNDFLDDSYDHIPSNSSINTTPPESPRNQAPAPSSTQKKDILDWKTAVKDTLDQSGNNALKGLFVAGRYLAVSLFLSKINERLLAPNTLICLLESLQVVLGGRSLNSIQTEIGQLNGEIKALKEKITRGETLSEEETQTIKENMEKIGATVRQGSVFAGVIGATIGAMYYFANHQILRSIGQHEFAVDEARKYFQTAAPGYLALMFFTVQQRFFQGIKNSKATLYSSALHCMLIVGLSYPIMFGKVSFMPAEMTGAGWAFTIATYTTLFLHSLYMRFANALKDYVFYQTKDTFNLEKIVHLAHVGIPSGIQCAVENGSSIVNSIFLGRMGGLDALTADQISLQIAQLSSIANSGVGNGVSACVSNAKGEKLYNRMRRYGYTGMVMSMILPTLAITLLLPLNENFISIFIDTNKPQNTEIITLAKHFLLLECMRQFVTGLQLTTGYSLQGIKDTKFPMYTSIGFAMLMNLAIAFLCADALKSSLQIIYASKAIGFFMTAVFNFGRWTMKGHEVSGEDQKLVEGKSTCERLGRGISLFLGKSDPLQTNTENDQANDQTVQFVQP